MAKKNISKTKSVKKAKATAYNKKNKAIKKAERKPFVECKTSKGKMLLDERKTLIREIKMTYWEKYKIKKI